MAKIFDIILNFFKALFSHKEEDNTGIVVDTVIIENNTIETAETMATIEQILKLRVERIYTCASYTIGKLYINGDYFCDTIEDCDRKLDWKMSLAEIQKIKVKDVTAIPTGIYNIDMNTKSPKYSNFTKYKWAAEFDGKLPRLENVPGYDGVLIHVGNTAGDTSGCLLVGMNTAKGKVTTSRVCFKNLMNNYLIPANKKGYKIQIEYIRKY